MKLSTALSLVFGLSPLLVHASRGIFTSFRTVNEETPGEECPPGLGITFDADFNYINIHFPQELRQPYDPAKDINAVPYGGCRSKISFKYPNETYALEISSVTASLDLDYGAGTRLESVVGLWFAGSGGNWFPFQWQGPREGPFVFQADATGKVMASGDTGTETLTVHFQLVFHGDEDLPATIKPGITEDDKYSPYLRLGLKWTERK